MASFVLFVNFFIGLLLALYYFYKKYSEYWKNRDVPYLQPYLWHGNSKGMGTKYHTYEFIKKIYETLKNEGPVGGAFISIRPVAFINDLDLVKSVLVKDFKYFQNRK